MKPTAIQRMVDVLKSQIMKTSHGDLTEFGEGSIFFLKDMLENAEMFLKQEQEEARRLAEIEAKEKPQADAGLMEAIRRVISECGWHSEIASRLEEVLSNYHPAHSTTDIVKELKGFLEWRTHELGLGAKEDINILINKFSNEKKGGVL